MNRNWRLKGVCPASLVEAGEGVSQAGCRGGSEKWQKVGRGRMCEQKCRTCGINERCLPSGE